MEYHVTSTHTLYFSLVNSFLIIVTQCFLGLFKEVLNDVIISFSNVHICLSSIKLYVEISKAVYSLKPGCVEDIFRTDEWPIQTCKLIHPNPLDATTIRQIVPLEKLLKRKKKTFKEMFHRFQKKYISRLNIFVIWIYEKRREGRKIMLKEEENVCVVEIKYWRK